MSWAFYFDMAYEKKRYVIGLRKESKRTNIEIYEKSNQVIWIISFLQLPVINIISQTFVSNNHFLN